MNIKLMEDNLSKEEFEAVNKCLKSGRYTQGPRVAKFEQRFAKWNDSNYAVMVNSGSSANLLAAFIMKERYGLSDGDEVLVPAVTWATTIFPVIQCNLDPVFCDVDESFNISIDSMKRMVSEKTKAVFIVHLLGQPANMNKILEFCEQKGLIIIEDCCESLGSQSNNIKVGNFGAMGTFSFYFGHHMTTIEGGMIVTHDEHIADLLRSARSHGWVRGSPRAERHKSEFPSTDFVFDMLGYNLRSTDINAAIGLTQLEKLDSFIDRRKANHHLFQKLFQERTLQKVNLNETSSFSLAALLNSKEERDRILINLPGKGIECRQIVAGNLLEQPVFKEKYRGHYRADDCQMADKIHHNGLYLPNNQFLDEKEIIYMVQTIKKLLD